MEAKIDMPTAFGGTSIAASREGKAFVSLLLLLLLLAAGPTLLATTLAAWLRVRRLRCVGRGEGEGDLPYGTLRYTTVLLCMIRAW